MSEISQSTNSINQLLQIFKHFRDQNYKESQLFSSQAIEQPLDVNSTRGDSFALDNFSFSKQKHKKQPFGLYSSLQRVNRSKEKMFMYSHKISHANQSTYNTNIFDRLYQENQVLKAKREKLFQEGRRSIQAKQAKQCTFSPNKKIKTRTQRSVSIQQSEAFFKKNMDWQNKRQMSIKKKQCDKPTNQEHLTFAPKIHSFKKKGVENKENQYRSHKKKTDSYLHNYHSKNSKKEEGESRRIDNGGRDGGMNMRRGYFSYIH